MSLGTGGESAVEDHESELSRIERRSVFEEIFDRVMAYIVSEGLRPGDRLPPERELMARLGVGRSSLREALKALGALGVIKSAHGDGMFVGTGETTLLARPLSWGMLMSGAGLRQLIEARAAIESELAALAARHATSAERNGITAAMELMRATDTDVAAYVEADLRFHFSIASASHNEVLHYTLRTLTQVMRVWIEQVISIVEHEPSSLHEHIPICDAVVSGDAPQAADSMRHHILAAGERLASIPQLADRAASPPPHPR